MPPRRPKTSPDREGKPSSKLHMRLAQEIGARILRGTYPPGSLLPNEAEWSRMFGASRTAVREAIKTLSGKGLLVSHPKVGSRVEPRSRWSLLDRDVFAWHSAASDQRTFLESTQEVRRLLETGIAELAAVKRTPEQLRDILEALDGMRAARTRDEMVKPDVRFHLSLLAAANNDLLNPFGIIIEQALENLFGYTTRHNPRPQYVIPLHEAVFTAVEAGNPAAARQAVEKLLDDTDAIIALGPQATRDDAEPEAPKGSSRKAGATT